VSAGQYTSAGAGNATSSLSVYLGYDTRPLASGDTNEIVIGTSAIGNGSNTVTIGNSGITKTYLKGDVVATTVNTIPISTGAGAVASNTAVGAQALISNTTGYANTANGVNALQFNTTGYYNTANGVAALSSNTAGYANTANGVQALLYNTTGYYNTANSHAALLNNTTGYYNTANGVAALSSNTAGYANTANGAQALISNTTGNWNTANGMHALYYNTDGHENAANGVNALFSNTTGYSNTADGNGALQNNTTGNYNTANGFLALYNNATYNNTTGLGYNAQVTGDNQLQLGDTSTTPYAYAALSVRSDARDKTDIRDTQLGLNFITKLRPVDYKWDMREDYRTPAPSAAPNPTAEQEAEYKLAMAAWLESNKLANITHNGSKTRTRYHHGLIAQEVKQVLIDNAIDCAAFQDHTLEGGDDVLTIGYGELIAPMIKAIQELKVKTELGAYTVATLPAGVTGARAYVTDATAPTYNGALTGGGTVVVPVFYNGSAWVSA